VSNYACAWETQEGTHR